MDDLNRLLDERDKASNRALFIARNMGDLPQVYRDKMPATSDMKLLADSEQAIREQYRADMKRHTPFHAGYLSVNPDGSIKGPGDASIRAQMGQAEAEAELKEKGGGGAPHEPPLDLSNMTTSEKIRYGLSQSRPGQSNSASRGVGVNHQARTPQPGGSPAGKNVTMGDFLKAGGGALNLAGMTASQKMALGLSMSQPSQRRR